MFLEGVEQKYFKSWQHSLYTPIQRIFFTATFVLFGKKCLCHLASYPLTQLRMLQGIYSSGNKQQLDSLRSIAVYVQKTSFYKKYLK